MIMNITLGLLNDLTNGELKLYLTMKFMIPTRHGLEVSYDEIADCSGLNRRTIQNLMPGLIDKGYIHREWSGGAFPPTYKILK